MKRREMTGREYRKPISKHPPRYCDSSERRIMIAPFSRKITGKWDEEYVVARIIANMNIVGRWLSCIMPNLYFESGLRSGLMVTMSAPSQSIDPTMSFPGDVDILAIPYDENDLVLSETIAIEIKVLRGDGQRPGKSPNKFGYSQAASLLNHGFLHVAVGHVIVTDDPLNNPNRSMFVASVGKGGFITSCETVKLDMFENDLAKRDFGRLACNRSNEQIGYFVMNYDGERIFEPMGHSCIRNQKYCERLADCVYRYYKENYELFFEIPRYSDSEIKLWEKRIEENPAIETPWGVYRKLFRGERIQEVDTLLAMIDGRNRIGYLCRTKGQDFFLCDMS